VVGPWNLRLAFPTVWTGVKAEPIEKSRFSSSISDVAALEVPCEGENSVLEYIMSASQGQGGGRGSDAASRSFAAWFFEVELRASARMGIAAERAEFHLCRAIANLERGMLREALADANTAAHLDEALRPRALIVARLCIQREISEREPPER